MNPNPKGIHALLMPTLCTEPESVEGWGAWGDETITEPPFTGFGGILGPGLFTMMFNDIPVPGEWAINRQAIDSLDQSW